MRAFVLLVAAGALGAGPLHAQEVVARPAPGPHYAGVPVEIVLRVQGFEEQPQPEVSVPAPTRGRLESAGVSPNVSSSVSIVNGQVSHTKTVEFVYRYRFLTAEPGAVGVGPFEVRQGSLVRVAPGLQLRIREVPVSDRLKVSLALPEGPLYVGARVPVVLELRIDGEFQKRLHEYTLRAPLFDLSDSFRFLDPPERPGDTLVPLETASGTLNLRGRVRETSSDAGRFVVIRTERTAIPLHAGIHDLAPASAVVDEAIRWKRDLFGRRVATHVRKWRTSDRPRRVEVRALPSAGRPESFAGAVGRGFTLDVAADRSVVQAGDPITLTLMLRGEGNLETVGFPRLDAAGLLQAGRFRVPDNDLTGTLEEGTKRFTAVVRVLDDTVGEIPALTYWWFDPEAGRYESTQSRPIALSVQPAEVVRAEDVVAAPTRPTVEGARTGPLALTGADLSIERDPTRLLRRPGDGRPGWLLGGMYIASLTLLGTALWDRRRRSVDPARVRLQRVLEGELRRIRHAADLPAREAAETVARALRGMLAELPVARDEAVERVLGECDARIYAPPGSQAEPLPASLHAEALAAARRLLEGAA